MEEIEMEKFGYRFSFGPWNIHEGADPFGPVVRPTVPFEEKLGILKDLGFDAIQFHDDDAVPDLDNLSAGEIISAFILPETAADSGAAYVKLGRRGGGGDCALVGVAAFLTMQSDHAKQVRIAMSSVGPKPLRALQAEEVVLSGPLNETRMREAAATAAEEAAPITDMRCSASYRKEMVNVLTFRALQQAQQKAQGGKVK